MLHIFRERNHNRVKKENQAEAEKSSSQAVVRPMTIEDIPTILTIEEVSFPAPWSMESFRSEISDNSLARYYCLELEEKVIGYMGLWLIIGEAHITNIAIWPGCRGQGWGEFLLRSVMTEMIKIGIYRLTLEVRVSNTNAQNLYKKLGFQPAGIRKRYYSDNQEDALIMWASL